MKGIIKKIIGPVVDVAFQNYVPALYTALTIEHNGKILVLETEQHVGNNTVRALAMDTTDGLFRGMEVTDTGAPISVPVGSATLGRVFNVLGEAVDRGPEVLAEYTSPIHREAPAFVSQSIKVEILETGIKVIDLICPVLKGGKVDRKSVV